MVKILVVEDDEKLNRMLCLTLEGHGYDAVGCLNGASALEKLEEEKFSLVISDVMMPETDGFELAKAIRSSDKRLPILFTTARDDLESKQRGFRIGIDDYLVKPFEPIELVLRVGALLRRAEITDKRRITVGNLVMDEEEHNAYVDGEELPLTVREFDMLYKFLSYPKKTFTRAKLMDEFWDYDSSSTSRTVDVYVAKIREKTAACTGFELVTVHGLGYKAVLK